MLTTICAAHERRTCCYELPRMILLALPLALSVRGAPWLFPASVALVGHATEGEFVHYTPSWFISVMLVGAAGCVAAFVAVALWLHQRAKHKSRVREKEFREFLGVVSHDLRAPLANVQGFLEILLHSNVDAEQRVSIPRALANVDRLSHLVANLLHDAALEAGASVSKRRNVRVNDVVAAVTQWAGAAAELKGVRLAVRPRDGLPPVWADPLGLSRVLANLIDNAVKFSPEGAAVTVSTGLSGELVAMTVEDSGPGLTDAQSQKLFQPFHRSAVHPENGGTGLGLYIVKRLVTEMNGRIEVNSVPGCGSRFTVLLPMARGVDNGDRPPEAVVKLVGTNVPRARVA